MPLLDHGLLLFELIEISHILEELFCKVPLTLSGTDIVVVVQYTIHCLTETLWCVDSTDPAIMAHSTCMLAFALVLICVCEAYEENQATNSHRK